MRLTPGDVSLELVVTGYGVGQITIRTDEWTYSTEFSYVSDFVRDFVQSLSLVLGRVSLIATAVAEREPHGAAITLLRRSPTDSVVEISIADTEKPSLHAVVSSDSLRQACVDMITSVDEAAYTANFPEYSLPIDDVADLSSQP